MNGKATILALLLLAASCFAQQTGLNGYSVSATGVGLKVCIGPGSNTIAGSIVTLAGTCLALSPKSVNYGYLDAATGNLTVKTTRFPVASVPIFTATTDSVQVTSVTDSARQRQSTE